MRGSHVYLEGGHRLDPPEQRHLPEFPTLNDSWNNQNQTHLKLVVTQKKSFYIKHTEDCYK